MLHMCCALLEGRGSTAVRALDSMLVRQAGGEVIRMEEDYGQICRYDGSAI